MNNDTLELNTFEYTDHSALDLEHETDPDNIFFSSINNNCHYYTGEQFNRSIKTDGKLSIIHFNSRSLYANFTSIRDYVDTFSQPLNIIAISETWLNEDRELDFDMDSYELSYINRQNKGGGGVAIYVDKTLNFKVLESMTTVVDNVSECISIEICKEKRKI
jgi:ASC-1-like (ASCH) protein